MPTQVLTSGDDRTVKFWDVSRAMGMDNPLPGGKYSKCPFADYSNCQSNDYHRTHNNNSSLAGSVVPLLSLQTGHRANVFHVTPVDAHPGRVLTCGADGFLRMANVTRPENESSSVVVSPEFGIEGSSMDDLLPLGLFSLRSEKCMCFSHHLLNANTGLLCGERGLFQFDLRLSPREQSTRSLLGNDKGCKSCAIWSAPPSSMDIVDSAYVFAGGASSEVALYDLRMTDGSESRIVQKYRPSGLSRDSEVSVSGLDVSKDKRELLVSYENDQVRVSFTISCLIFGLVFVLIPSRIVYLGFLVSSISKLSRRSSYY
jgi:WD40 repeat protein